MELLDVFKQLQRGEFFSNIFSYTLREQRRRGFQDMSVEVSKRAESDSTVITAVDSNSSLKLSLCARVYRDYPAVEWVINLENIGTSNTPILSNILPMDIEFNAADILEWNSLEGDSCSERSFMPVHHRFDSEDSLTVAPVGGRSSNGSFPFFNVCCGDYGVLCAIGWSGQWKVSLCREHGIATLQAGVESTRLYLTPGESIRTPKILLMKWERDVRAAHQQFTKLLAKYYSPKMDSHTLPISLQNFDRYVRVMPEWSSEEGQLLNIIAAGKCEWIDTYWLDAAWFPGGFPDGVGNLYPSDAFPHTLRYIADRVHEKGMKFMLWFELERVCSDTQVHREHPDWLIATQQNDPSVPHPSHKLNYLFNLGNKDAREWLTKYIGDFIEANQIDIYRQDFNMDPLAFWRSHDPDDRQGVTEIKYVTGLYEFWDALLKRFPNLIIDNCSSGGRRIDIETCSRSVPMWRSDIACWPDTSTTWKQNQTMTLSQYLPFHSTSSWSTEAYDMRSATTRGLAAQFDVLNPDFGFEDAIVALKEAKRLQSYWSGNFYPLTKVSLDASHWSAFQLHQAELDRGVVVLFRREKSPYRTAVFNLREIDPTKRYQLVISDEQRRSTLIHVHGTKLKENFEVEIPMTRNSMLIEYSISG